MFNIYKKSNLNLNSKITTTHIIGNALYIASFDRNIYKVELDTLKIDKIMQTSNLPTAMMDLNQELIIGLIDGNIIYKDKIYKISNNQISAIKIYKDNIYIGDWDSNLYIYDLNLNLKIVQKSAMIQFWICLLVKIAKLYYGIVLFFLVILVLSN